MNTLRILCLVCMCMLLPSSLHSVTAVKYTLTAEQLDGSIISLLLNGDEYYHYYSTVDSIPVYEKDDSFYYGFLDNGELKVSDILAHDKESRTREEIRFEEGKTELIAYIRDKRKGLVDSENNRRKTRAAKKTALGEGGNFNGLKKGLVVLVEFEDLSFVSENAGKDFDKMFNLPGYNLNGSIGSVRDYFMDQSYGKFTLSFDVIGPVKLSHNHGYYGANSLEGGIDKRVYEMVIEACGLIDSEVDFTQYDWDNDGEADQVFFIYAGYGEHAGAPANTIWPHESHLGSRKITLDGVDINTYACSSELCGNTGATINGIGTSCHEFSHCLGLPDLYDTDYSGAFGMSFWDLMNSGSYAGPQGNGEVPYGYSAYERWYAGWLEPTVVSDTQENLELRDLGMHPEAYVIYNAGNENEYYMLENHQSDRWFQYAGTGTDMHGLMVTHVDFDAEAWLNNLVNPNSKHQRMSIIPADNQYGNKEEDLRGDLFPGSSNATLLTKDSHKETGGRLFNENIDGSFDMHLAIASIEEHNKKIMFDIVNTMDFPTPNVSEATDITTEGYTANWEEMPDVDRYIVEQTTTYYKYDFLPVTKKESKEIQDGTSSAMAWLIDGCNAKYRVKGIIKGISTEWSEYQVVGYPSKVEMNVDDINDQDSYFGVDGTKHSRPVKGINIVVKNNKAKKILTGR